MPSILYSRMGGRIYINFIYLNNMDTIVRLKFCAMDKKLALA